MFHVGQMVVCISRFDDEALDPSIAGWCVMPIADEFEHIRKRREEIAREEGRVPEPTWVPPANEDAPDAEKYPSYIGVGYACGFPAWVTPAIERFNAWAEEERERATPGEFTDGA
jgi:hypothetical protein